MSPQKERRRVLLREGQGKSKDEKIWRHQSVVLVGTSPRCLNFRVGSEGVTRSDRRVAVYHRNWLFCLVTSYSSFFYSKVFCSPTLCPVRVGMSSLTKDRVACIDCFMNCSPYRSSCITRRTITPTPTHTRRKMNTNFLHFSQNIFLFSRPACF